MDRSTNFVDKVLKILKWICIDFFRYKLIHHMLIMNLILYSILIVIQSVYFVYTWNLHDLIQYGPIYFSFYYIVATILTALFFTEVLINSLQILEKVNMEEITENTFKRMKVLALSVTGYVVVAGTTAIFSAVLFVIPDPYDNQYFFPYKIFELFIPNWSFTPSLIYRTSSILTAYIMPSICYQLMYVGVQCKLQMYVVFEMVEASKILENNHEEKFTTNESYHSEIRKLLVSITNIHDSLLRCGSAANKHCSVIVPITCIPATLMAISILFLYFTLEGTSNLVKYYRVGSFGLAGALAFCGVMITGQMIESFSDELFDAISNLKWYNYNQENKKIYVILLAVLNKGFKVECSPQVSVNYELAIRIVKSIYSIGCVIIQMRKI